MASPFNLWRMWHIPNSILHNAVILCKITSVKVIKTTFFYTIFSGTVKIKIISANWNKAKLVAVSYRNHPALRGDITLTHKNSGCEICCNTLYDRRSPCHTRYSSQKISISGCSLVSLQVLHNIVWFFPITSNYVLYIVYLWNKNVQLSQKTLAKWMPGSLHSKLGSQFGFLCRNHSFSI